MNLSEIKNTINIQTLNLNISQDANKVDTSWLRHWDNANRVAVSIHMDTYTALKNDSTISTLEIQTEQKEGAKGMYTALRIVMHKPSTHQL
jgi:hypothetical protein